ncbi:hypothetical protein SDC9_106163 [bioreactor metagenome]|uniref:Uncharacterized protein n=1 Tax=bioreactor metagenome TaxID=1076179 RepID=A0A645B832_9ZZZZ
MPNLKCEVVVPPDFLLSYEKYPCTYKSVLSPIIFMAVLFAPTVPSEPSPQILQLIVPSGEVSTMSVSGREVNVTSSTIPIVKLSFGSLFFKFSNTAMIWLGLVSFEDNPYLPPTISGGFS